MQNELHRSITATELVRNFSKVIDEVQISGQSIYITKSSQTVAQLSPPPKNGYPIKKLANLLSSLPDIQEESKTMADDLQNIKHQATLMENPWD